MLCGVLVDRLGASPLTVAGLGLVAAGMFLASGWDLNISDPQLTIHLLMAGLGFGLVIAPITLHALSAASENHKGTASSLVVVSRMMGMALGLAALSAWGVDYFQGLIEGHDFPLIQVREAARAFELRAIKY